MSQQEPVYQSAGQRRSISGQHALLLLRDVALALEDVTAPRVPGTSEIQAAADLAMQNAIDGHDVRIWDSESLEVRGELSRRWFSLAEECASFGAASMLSLPWGTSDRAVRDMLLTQLMSAPSSQAAKAA
jgi:hypothetical protein